MLDCIKHEIICKNEQYFHSLKYDSQVYRLDVTLEFMNILLYD